MLELPSIRIRLLHAGAFALFALLCAAPDIARADVALAADLELDVPVDAEVIDTGPAFAIRLGYQMHLPLFTLTPEIGFHYASFDPEPTLYRGILGARLGFGELLRFGVFAHIGYGHASIDTPIGDASHSAFTFDLGAFLDLTMLPLIDLGVHVGYGSLSADDDGSALKWIPVGVHAALVF